MADYLADSFAFIAILEGNERYHRLSREKKLLTTSLNVLEVYATLLRRVSVAEARQAATDLLPLVTDVPPDVALEAGDFRRAMRQRRRDCSYIDAWGYAAARRMGLPFLTGDPAFRGVDHVEFVR